MHYNSSEEGVILEWVPKKKSWWAMHAAWYVLPFK